MADDKSPNSNPLSAIGDLLGQFSPRKWGAGAWGNGFLASLFLYLLLRCQGSKDQLWNDRLNDVKAQAQQQGQVSAQKATAEVVPQIKEMKAGIDSLNQIVDSVNKKQ
jgi:hypothetical protein